MKKVISSILVYLLLTPMLAQASQFDVITDKGERYIEVSEPLFLSVASDLKRIPDLERTITELTIITNEDDTIILKLKESKGLCEKSVTQLKSDEVMLFGSVDKLTADNKNKIETIADMKLDAAKYERNKWFYFAGGVLVTAAALYLASSVVK